MSIIVKIESVAIDENQIAESSVKIKDVFEKNSTLSANLYYEAVDGFPEEGRDIEIYEDTIKKFGGIIKTINPVPINSDQSTSSYVKLAITSDGYDGIPIRRTINVNFTNTTAGAIVSTLISDYLVDEGVTAGTINTGATMDTYQGMYKSIKEILDELADASGCTWYINNDKELNFIVQITPTISGKTLDSDDGDHFNFRPNRSLTRFRNKQFVEGGTDADGGTVRVFVEDTVDIAARALAENNSGVYGNVYRDTTIQNETDALTVANELLNRYSKPASAKFSSYALYTEFDVGDIIEVTYPKYGIVSGSEYLVTNKITSRQKHRWVYNYSIEARDTSSYSGKTKSNAVDFFSKLASGTGLVDVSNTDTGDIYVQDDEPSNVQNKTLWEDTDDYSKYDILIHSTDATLNIEDGEMNFASGTITLALFTAVDQDGVVAIFKNTGTGIITIATNGTETIDGATTYLLSSQYDTVTVISNGSNWSVI